MSASSGDVRIDTPAAGAEAAAATTTATAAGAQRGGSALRLSATSIFLASELSIHYVDVSWRFEGDASLLDWIGLFAAGEQLRGGLHPRIFWHLRASAACRGARPSQLSRLSLVRRSRAVPRQHTVEADAALHAGQHEIGARSFSASAKSGRSAADGASFSYFSGQTGSCRAASPSICVYSEAKVIVTCKLR